MEFTAAIPIDVQANMVIKQITLDQAAMAKVYDTMDAALKKGVVLEYEQALHFMKRAGIDPFKEAMAGGTGGGAGKGLTVGMAALAAVGVALTVVLKKMVDNSKIANTLISNFNKGLGLMLDLILIPFIPILIGVLIGFYEAIMWLGEKWEAYVNFWAGKNETEPTEDTQEKMKEIYGSPGKWASEAIANFERELREKIDNALVSIRIRLSEMVEEGKQALWGVVNYLWGVGSMVKDKIEFGFQIVSNTFWDVINWLYGVLFKGEPLPPITIDFSESGLGDIVNSLKDILALKEQIQGGIQSAGNTAFGWWWNEMDKSMPAGWRQIPVNDTSQLRKD